MKRFLFTLGFTLVLLYQCTMHPVCAQSVIFPTVKLDKWRVGEAIVKNKQDRVNELERPLNQKLKDQEKLKIQKEEHKKLVELLQKEHAELDNKLKVMLALEADLSKLASLPEKDRKQQEAARIEKQKLLDRLFHELAPQLERVNELERLFYQKLRDDIRK